MMEFIAGFGIGLWVGVITTALAIIWLKDHGFVMTRQINMTEREAERFEKAIAVLRDNDKATADRLDAVSDVLDGLDERIKDMTDRQTEDREKFTQLVDIVSKEEA